MTRTARAVLPLLLLAGCGSTSSALLLEVDPAEVPEVQQLRLVARWDDGTLAFGPTIRPEVVRGSLQGRQSLKVLLPKDAHGALRVEVEALVEGEFRGQATGAVQVRAGEEVRLSLALERAAAVCGACDGCCSGRTCVGASVGACGSGGVACAPCDPVLADRCSDEGRCACGTGPSCSPEQGADRCVNGACRCGQGSPCGPGQQCDNGVCRCTPDSCAGCCVDNTCLPGTEANACGADGTACRICGAAQSCSAGTCVG